MVARSTTVSTPAWTYPAAQIASDFGGAFPAAFEIKVRQFSLSAGWGLPASRHFMF
jgi:hypothetical protein